MTFRAGAETRRQESTRPGGIARRTRRPALCISSFLLLHPGCAAIRAVLVFHNRKLGSARPGTVGTRYPVIISNDYEYLPNTSIPTWGSLPSYGVRCADELGTQQKLAYRYVAGRCVSPMPPLWGSTVQGRERRWNPMTGSRRTSTQQPQRLCSRRNPFGIARRWLLLIAMAKDVPNPYSFSNLTINTEKRGTVIDGFAAAARRGQTRHSATYATSTLRSVRSRYGTCCLRCTLSLSPVHAPRAVDNRAIEKTVPFLAVPVYVYSYMNTAPRVERTGFRKQKSRFTSCPPPTSLPAPPGPAPRQLFFHT